MPLAAAAEPLPAVAQAASDPAKPAPAKVRVAMSARAAERLVELRVRRLISFELDEVAEVERDSVGPLNDDLIRVWIDVPSSRRVLIEVRREGRSLARRVLAISDFSPGVAARVVSIAAADMVRVQARLDTVPVEPVGPPSVEAAIDDARVAFDASMMAMIAPQSLPLVSFGPELALEHRERLTPWLGSAQTLYGRLLIGEQDDRRLQWLEAGVALALRMPLSPRWRVQLAAKVGGALMSVPFATMADGAPTGGREWSARGGGLAAIEARVAPDTWLALGVEPGALLRDMTLVHRDGTRSDLSGFTLGIALGLSVSPWSTASEAGRESPRTGPPAARR